MDTPRVRADWFDEPTLAVLVSGVASMGLEILAGRMIAPEFGSSIYTWGSIIGVFLTALSLGYARGGRRAQTVASVTSLRTLLLWSTVYVAFLIFAGDFLIRQTATLPIPARFGSLVPVTLLFGPPTYLLGFISPYAAELSRTESTGAASGRVYALGTIGSIVGAFGTTFLLIPAFSIEVIGLIFGGMTLVTAAALAFPSPSNREVIRVLLVTALLLGAVLAPPFGVAMAGETVYETQTAHQQLRVADQDGVRTLYLDGVSHSAMDLEDPDRHVFTYTRYFHLPFLYTDSVDDVENVLFIGGGGFTGPKIFAQKYDVNVDVVEIDPGVVQAARDYFDLETGPDLSVHTMDGRQYLRETDTEYDLIVLDAYKRDTVPFHLTTTEFFDLTTQRLSADGVLLANIISAPSGSGSAFFRAEYRTMETVFPTVTAFRTAQPGVVQNVEIVATKQSSSLSTAELRERAATRPIGYELDDAIDRQVESVRTTDVPVLRDDDAPVDSLLDPMVGQRYVIETGERTTTA
ncbi:spermidine synthase [Halodesulfurarchaeum formicicum]|uniref:spermidine synthase n=1 Tax=Halodesulfurarchaeum formicicum TaxID=1873524 RepID=UPI0009041735|nr:fused MFS/spermidine synthase [Halodesulfurarchaeum formicicum]